MRQIPGFSNYSITKDGRVWSKPKQGSGGHKGKWLKSVLDSRYLIVELRKDKKPYKKLLHRLVLETYVGPCPEGMGCRHLNGDPFNNNVSNLAWGTQKENVGDSIQHGTFSGLHKCGEKHENSKLTEQQVRLIFYVYHDGAYTQQELADHFGVGSVCIHKIVNKKTWRHLWDG